jgi:PAS domain S-box-containing protein
MNKRFKILAVDDDPVNISVMASALMDEYDIITALNGHDAISQVKEHIPDLILLDIMMPDLNGFEVCSIIKSYQEYADIPVIFLTALDTYDGELRGLELGAIDYLTKPINFTLLKLRVYNHIALKERNNLVKEQRDLLADQNEELELINKQIRATKAELRENQKKLSDIIDFLPDATLAIDRGKRVIIWNRAIEEMTGIPAAEMIGKGDNAYTIPFYGEAQPNLMNLVFEERDEIAARYPNVTRSGDTLMGEVFCKSLYNNKGAWVFAKASPLHDQAGNVIGVIESIRDITILKQAELKLREANEFSEQIIRSAQEGVIVYDLNLRYRVWNPFMEQISGKNACEVLGRHPSELFPFVQSSGLTERLESVLAGDVPVTIDFPYSVEETGKTGWCSDLSVPLRDANGQIIGVIATIRDISWRKHILEELNQALEDTKSANNTMSRLLRTVSHEFRTPLGLLTASTDILDRYWDRLTPEKRSEQNEHIRSAASQLSNLLNSVILFTQTGVDKPMKPPQMLNVESLCRSIAAEIVTFWGVGHAFNVTIAADCGAALLDENLFRRILENLLTNAFRYTPSGGEVTLRVYREKNQLCLEIIDSGIGILEEEQKLIFDAFYRGANVEGQRGLGLGLSIVNEALSDMGGTIMVKSRTGAGTTMRVEIPICTQS